MRKAVKLAAALVIGSLAVAGAQAQEERKTPYWASIAASEALMRTGPGKNYPGVWLYKRADLPIKVLEVYPSWRKVQDPDGATGWMLVNLLSDTRTAVVRGNEPAPMHVEPNAASRVRYRAAPGVVGRISDCAGNWCRFEAKGRRGYIGTDRIWGTDPGETVE